MDAVGALTIYCKAPVFLQTGMNLFIQTMDGSNGALFDVHVPLLTSCLQCRRSKINFFV